ncbi:MAG: response regulator [Planctomycetes bacterium]|nr:response regulator [Planctomycetota bacterium]
MTQEQARKKILLVDDDREILGAMAAALGDLDAEILTANNGNDAVTMAEAHKPDLMVLDQMMPGRNGLVVLEKVKKGKKKTDPPRVIMVTANPGSRHKDFAAGMGVDAYLNKPFRMEKLVETVKKILHPDDPAGTGQI